MNGKAWGAIVLSSLAMACGSGAGSSSDPGFGTGGSGAHGSGPNGAAASSGSSGGGASSGGLGGSGGGGGQSSGGPSDSGARFIDAPAHGLFDSGPPPEAAVAQQITLTMDSFQVQPGDEVYKCQQFGNPFGQDVDLVYFEGQMSQGSHHFFLFNMDPTTGRNTTAPFQDCPGAGLEFHPFPYLSQQPHWIVSYPDPGMAYPLVSANGLMINVHYLNTGSSPLTTAVTITMTTAKPGTVTTHVGSIFLNNTFFSVPANTPMSKPVNESATTIPLANDYSIFTSWSHMHQTSLKFEASANGNVFYTETNWDTPQLVVHDPPLKMAASTPIEWSCDYYNETANDLLFGDSATKNVMCIYIGQYYPADPTNPDIIAVLQ